MNSGQEYKTTVSAMVARAILVIPQAAVALTAFFAMAFRGWAQQTAEGNWADVNDPEAKQLIEQERKWAVLSCSPSNVRVGYYSRQDGLNVIWIATPEADYGQTTDHGHLRGFFRIFKDSGVTASYGDRMPRLGALPSESS